MQQTCFTIHTNSPVSYTHLALLLAALLDVLKEAINDQYDYISWWLYDAAPDYEVWTDDEKTKWCLMEPEALYDFIRDECQG